MKKSFPLTRLFLAVVLMVILVTAVACPSNGTPTTTTTTAAPTTTTAAATTTTAAPTGTATATATITGVPTVTASPTVTGVPTGTASPTATGVPTGSPTATATGVPTGTASPTVTASPTATGVPTGTASPTVTGVPTGSPTATVTGVPTGSPTASPAGAIGTVEVLGVWGSTELESFQAMVAPWQQQTGGRMNFTGTRDLTAVLTTRIQAGNPPDIAILPNPGLMVQYANAGNLQPLNDLLDMSVIEQQYSEAWRELGTVDNNLYAIFMKGVNKATIWYNPKTFTQNGWNIPSTWDELISLSDTIVSEAKVPAAPWSVGVEAAQASGFAATDWISQIFLTKYGPEVYDQWVNHEIPWTDPRIKDAWEMFGTIVNTEGYVPGGATAALATNFQDASYLPFQEPPQAAMYYEGDFVQGFIRAQFPALVAGEDYDFFPFPAIPNGTASPAASPTGTASPTGAPVAGVVTGGADLVVAFKDNPTIRSFVSYLASPEAQTIWVERGGFTSLNTEVSLDAYADDIARKSVEQMINAQVFRFGAGDVMPGAMQTAWWAGVLQYLQNPEQLDSILSSLENSANTAYGTASPASTASPAASPATSPAASPTASPAATP